MSSKYASISTTLNEWTGWDLIPAYRGVQLFRYLAFSAYDIPYQGGPVSKKLLKDDIFGITINCVCRAEYC
jgi:hypothetical protein